MQKITNSELKNLIIDNKAIILDIGCYDGRDSIRFSEFLKDFVVYSFDPDPRSTELFRKNYKHAHNTLLYEIALSNFDGYINFYLSDSDTRKHYKDQKTWSASSSIKEPKFHKELFKDVYYKDVMQVRSKKLDTWYKEVIHNNQLLSFIWADVNGAEEDLILGGIKTLSEKTKYLYIEFSNKELFKNQINLDTLLKLIPMFEVMNFYDVGENFGNVLLKNKNL